MNSFLRDFAEPPGEFRPMPLWVWNGEMTEGRIREMLAAFAEQGMGGVFVHPRPGLRTDYLSPRWFELWHFAAEECRRLGMQCNIYDENSYPSGFAGGHVVAANPRLAKVKVEIRSLTSPPSKEDQMWQTPLAVCSASSQKVGTVDDLSEASPSNPLEVLYLVQDRGMAWLGGLPYADLSLAETTQTFIRCTHEAYARHCGEFFGTTTRYVFTDEPSLQSLGDYGKSGLVYSHAIEAEFRRDHGYGLLENMNRLMFNLPDSAAVRFDYGKTLDRLFTVNFVGQLNEWCREHGLAFTGHFNEHHWPLPGDPPNVMTALRRMEVPGNDMLGFQFAHEDREKSEHFRLNLHELRSVANQFGKKRTLVESCGGGGYGYTLKQTKALEDFLLVHGVNLMNPHLSYETLSGCRKYDWPQTYSDHSPWMDGYRAQADHVARVAWALAQGEEFNRVLVLHPTLSSWLVASYGSSAPTAEKQLAEIRADQDALLNRLCHAQIDFDLGDELLMEEAGFVEPGRLGIGERQYEVIVLPATVTSLTTSTVQLLRQFLIGGGVVYALCPPPGLVDGRPSEQVRELAGAHAGWKQLANAGELLPELVRAVPPRICTAEGGPLPPEICFRRVEVAGGDGEKECLYYFCNPWSVGVSVAVRIPGQSVEILDTASGSVAALPLGEASGDQILSLELPPAGHLLCRLLSVASAPATSPGAPGISQGWERVDWVFAGGKRTSPNTLTLDYGDLEAHHVSLESVPTIVADQACWQAMGFHANLWRSAVQYRGNFLQAVVPNPGPFRMTYPFQIAASDLDAVRSSLRVAVERPHLYALSCNGKALDVSAGEPWLDEEIRSFPVESLVQAGENHLTLQADPFNTLHEIAPAYLLGDFVARPCGQGFELAAGSGGIPMGRWTELGLPFYKDGVRYAGHIDLARPAKRLRVEWGEWSGSLVRVYVDGRMVGRIWREPYAVEVELPLGAGGHEIAVEVVGNLRNFFGPHFQEGLPLAVNWERAPSPQPPGFDYRFETSGLLGGVQIQVAY